MATDEEKLLLTIEARTALLERQMKNASQITGREFRGMERQAKSSADRMNAAFAGVKGFGSILAGGFVGGAVVAGAVKFSEAATRIDNALKVAGLSGEKLNEVYGQLRDSAVKNAAPLESLVELYGRAALIQNELGVSSQDLVKFTDNIALALRVSGRSAQESSGALLQLSQALGSGVVRAEEFNSIVEGAPTILQAAAKGIKEAEGSVAKLRTIMLAGQLSSKALFDGISIGSSTLAEKVQSSQITFGQAMENMKTALIDTAREFNTSTGASERLAGGINNLVQSVSSFDVSGFITKIQSMNAEFEKFLNNVGNADVFVRLNQALGLMDANGRVINPDLTAAKDGAAALEREVATLQKSIEKNTSLGFDNTEALARLAGVQAALNQIRSGISSIPVTLPNPSKGDAPANAMHPGNPDRKKDDVLPPTPISINDPKYKPPAKAAKEKGATAVKKTADDRINADIQQTKDRTAALVAEAEMVGKSYEAQEKRRMSLDLEQAALVALREEARRKGQTDLDSIKLSEEHKQKIDAVSEAYAKQAENLRKVQEQQDKAEQAAGDFYATFKDGAIGAITGANSLGDALSNLAKKLGDLLLNSAFDALFKPASGNNPGGSMGNIFSGIGKIMGFSSGGYTGGGGVGDVAGVVHGKEFVVNAQATARNRPLLEAINRGVPGYKDGGYVATAIPMMTPMRAPVMPNLSYGGGGSSPVSVTYAPTIDARGANAGAVARIEQAMARERAELPAHIVTTVRKAQKSRILS